MGLRGNIWEERNGRACLVFEMEGEEEGRKGGMEGERRKGRREQSEKGGACLIFEMKGVLKSEVKGLLPRLQSTAQPLTTHTHHSAEQPCLHDDIQLKWDSRCYL